MARRMRPAIVGRVTAMTRDEALAEDVAQETLLRLWQIRHKLDGYRSVDALVKVVARNLAIDSLRRSGATVSLDDLTAEGIEPLSADASVLLAETVERVDAVMAQLSPAQQAVMRMRHSDGLEMDEIARLTGTTEANVRVILCRARAKVKKLYFEE